MKKSPRRSRSVYGDALEALAPGLRWVQPLVTESSVQPRVEDVVELGKPSFEVEILFEPELVWLTYRNCFGNGECISAADERSDQIQGSPVDVDVEAGTGKGLVLDEETTVLTGAAEQDAFSVPAITERADPQRCLAPVLRGLDLVLAVE